VIERCPCVELIRVLQPLLRSGVVIDYACQSGKFPNGSTTVAGVFKFSEKVDTVATRARAEVVVEIVGHRERGFIGSSGSEW
jgi:hypothetical protein